MPRPRYTYMKGASMVGAETLADLLPSALHDQRRISADEDDPAVVILVTDNHTGRCQTAERWAAQEAKRLKAAKKAPAKKAAKKKAAPSRR